MSEYSHFQLIALHTPTHTGYAAGDAPKISEASKALLDAQVKGLEAPSADLNARLHRMIRVYEIATSHAKVDTSKTTLKTFMAPEFYFRPKEGGAQRSYSEKDKTYLAKALGAFKKQGWLFVFGTVVWGQIVADAGKTIVWNTALIVEDVPREVYKTNYSDRADEIAKEYRPKTLKSERKLKDLIDANIDFNKTIFKVAKLWIGIDICVDHSDHSLVARHVAKKAKTSKIRDLENGLDVQLLIACGAAVTKNGLCLDTGGSIVRVDGSPHIPPVSEIVRVLSLKEPTFAKEVTEKDKSNGWEGDNEQSFLELTTADKMPVSDSDKSCTQGLAFYGTLSVKRA